MIKLNYGFKIEKGAVNVFFDLTPHLLLEIAREQ
jgi:hypothetical protein